MKYSFLSELKHKCGINQESFSIADIISIKNISRMIKPNTLEVNGNEITSLLKNGGVFGITLDENNNVQSLFMDPGYGERNQSYIEKIGNGLFGFIIRNDGIVTFTNHLMHFYNSEVLDYFPFEAKSIGKIIKAGIKPDKTIPILRPRTIFEYMTICPVEQSKYGLREYMSNCNNVIKKRF